jgi:transcription antitermination factor NusG
MAMRLQDVSDAKATQVAGLKWYAVRAGTRQEGQLKAALKAKRFEVFYPQWKFWRRVRATNNPGERPVFPGYMFVLTDQDRFADIHAADGFHQFVRALDADGIYRPLPFPDVAIGDLMMRVDLGEFDKTLEDRKRFLPEKGREVGVTKGKWAGLVAEILSASPKQRHVVLALANMDEGPVSVPYSAIRPVEFTGGLAPK